MSEVARSNGWEEVWEGRWVHPLHGAIVNDPDDGWTWTDIIEGSTVGPFDCLSAAIRYIVELTRAKAESVLPADERQEQLHNHRKVAEHLALFQQAMDEFGVREIVADDVLGVFYRQLMQSTAMEPVLKQMSELQAMLRRMGQDDG